MRKQWVTRPPTSADVEFRLAQRLLGTHLYIGHQSVPGALSTPADQLVHASVLAFGDYLDGAVGLVSDPSSDTEHVGLIFA